MKLRHLSIFEFDSFALNHPLGSYHQTSSYALFASEQGYDYDILGLVDDDGQIHAASLILFKKIGMFNKYGYAPKGFLIDYYNKPLLEEFTKALKKFYYKKNFAFIKINPEIYVGNMDYKKKEVIHNSNIEIEHTLEQFNFRKLKDNRRFETQIPRFNAVQVLKNVNLKTLTKQTRNKINRSIRNGMSLIKGGQEDIEILYEFVKNKKDVPIKYYFDYYNAFSKKKAIDVFLVRIDFQECLINLRKKYDEELMRNSVIVAKVMENPSDNNLKRKLVSDTTLSMYNESIGYATRCLAKNKTAYIAGAMTIRYKNRVYIVISGFDQEFKKFCPNYFLHYMLMEYYKKDFDFMDLNGMTGDFSNVNPYKGLDEFKLGFNPMTFEYIGEFDFIINNNLYKSMEQSGQLAREFKKKEKSVNF